MKYGIVWYRDTDNLGDDIQTYASKKYYPRIDYLIERENLRGFKSTNGEQVKTIMNGWYMHNLLSWPPSKDISPLLLSMHFTDNEEIGVGDLYLQLDSYLKNKEVGCRDTYTQKRLSKYGIKNFFSGCLTLTIDKFDNLKKNDNILLIDVDNNFEKIFKKNNIKYNKLTNSIDPNNYSKDFSERMKIVEDRLKEMQSAKVVFTSRLHVALPCLAIGAKVILLLKKDYEKDRLESYLKYVNYYFEKDFSKVDLKNLIENELPSKNSFRDIKEELEKRCYDFINSDSKLEKEDIKYSDYYNNYDLNLFKALYDRNRANKQEEVNIWNEKEKIYDSLIKEENNYKKLQKDSKEVWNEKLKLQDIHINLQKEFDNLQSGYQQLQKDSKEVWNEKLKLFDSYTKLQEDYQQLQIDYQQLQIDYQQLQIDSSEVWKEKEKLVIINDLLLLAKRKIDTDNFIYIDCSFCEKNTIEYSLISRGLIEKYFDSKLTIEFDFNVKKYEKDVYLSYMLLVILPFCVKNNTIIYIKSLDKSLNKIFNRLIFNLQRRKRKLLYVESVKELDKKSKKIEAIIDGTKPLLNVFQNKGYVDKYNQITFDLIDKSIKKYVIKE